MLFWTSLKQSLVRSINVYCQITWLAMRQISRALNAIRQEFSCLFCYSQIVSEGISLEMWVNNDEASTCGSGKMFTRELFEYLFVRRVEKLKAIWVSHKFRINYLNLDDVTWEKHLLPSSSTSCYYNFL